MMLQVYFLQLIKVYQLACILQIHCKKTKDYHKLCKYGNQMAAAACLSKDLRQHVYNQ